MREAMRVRLSVEGATSLQRGRAGRGRARRAESRRALDRGERFLVPHVQVSMRRLSGLGSVLRSREERTMRSGQAGPRTRRTRDSRHLLERRDVGVVVGVLVLGDVGGLRRNGVATSVPRTGLKGREAAHRRHVWRVAADVLLTRRLVDPYVVHVHVDRPQGTEALEVDRSEVLRDERSVSARGKREKDTHR